MQFAASERLPARSRRQQARRTCAHIEIEESLDATDECFRDPVCIASGSTGEAPEDGPLGELAEKIGGGHAFAKHVLERGEFKEFGVETQAQLRHFTLNILRNAKTGR